MERLNHIYEEAKNYASNIIINYPERMVYHDMNFAKRYEAYINNICTNTDFSKEDIMLAKIGAWLISASYEDVQPKFTKNGIPDSNVLEEIKKTAETFFEQEPLDEKYKKPLMLALSEINFPDIPETKLGMLLADGMTADIIMGNGKKRMKKIYQEILLKDVNLSRSKWYDMVLNFASSFKFHLPYCKEEFQPKLDQFILDLQKERKSLEKSADLALKKELNISDTELKELKKNLRGVKGRDARGIQTIFRTTSKNHYTLNEMVDRKASIMITVNSIILSLVLGGVIGQELQNATTMQKVQFIPILILTLASVGSIILAILAIRPDKTHGQFTEDEIRNKGGNLLFYGNFHDMRERDYEWAFLQMMNDQDYMYGSMIKDIYYLGLILDKKYALLRKSLTIFLVGLVLAVLVSTIIRFYTIL